jgi:hypothetical protein
MRHPSLPGAARIDTPLKGNTNRKTGASCTTSVQPAEIVDRRWNLSIMAFDIDQTTIERSFSLSHLTLHFMKGSSKIDFQKSNNGLYYS